ncbi:MAG: hypothetical protein ABR559_02005 [Gemmatimonadota bacterium]
MRVFLTVSVVTLLLVPAAVPAQAPAAIRVEAGSSSVVPLRIDATGVQVFYKGGPATGVTAKLGKAGLDRTLEITADRAAPAGAGYAIRLNTGTTRVPDLPLEILPALATLALPPITSTLPTAAIRVEAGSSSVVPLPPQFESAGVQVLYLGGKATGVTAKLGQAGLDRTLEITADRAARAGAGYAIRFNTGTTRVPDLPLEILPALVFLDSPPITLTAPTKRITTAALKFTGQRPEPFVPKALTTAALKFTGQRPEPFVPRSITTSALRFTGTRP